MTQQAPSSPVFKFMAVRSPEKLAVADRKRLFFSRKARGAEPSLTQGFAGQNMAFLQEIVSLGANPAQWPQVKRVARQCAEARSNELTDTACQQTMEDIWRFCQTQTNEFSYASFVYGIARIIAPGIAAPQTGRLQWFARFMLLLRYYVRLVLWLINRRAARPQAPVAMGLPPSQVAGWVQVIESFAAGFETPGGDGLSFTDTCWDVLTALTIDSGFRPALREKVILYLKVINLCQSVKSIVSSHELHLSLASSPLIPEQALQAAPKKLYASQAFETRRNTEELELPVTAGVRPIGFGDLNIVRQTLQEYRMGELAHVENVMKSEYRERKHRRLNRTEESLMLSTETTKESEKDLQTTERNELQREANTTIKTDLKLDAGVNISASYGGTVTIQANTNFSVANSKTEATKLATSYAKEVVARSLERITEKVRQERTMKTLEEIEETNTHGFDNKAGTGHVIGLYRWLDKWYKAQVVNYGRRLMFEFIVPEPASFFIFAQARAQVSGVTLEKPEDITFTPADIAPDTYVRFGDTYHVTDLTPPPEEYVEKEIIVGYPSQQGNEEIVLTPNDRGVNVTKTVTTPVGYTAVECTVKGPGAPAKNWVKETDGNYWSLWVGDSSTTGVVGTFTMHTDADTIPVILYLVKGWFVYLIVTIKFKIKDYEVEKWRLKTYQAIKEAHQRLTQAYEDQVAAAAAAQGVVIMGKNPEINRQIEREELKKNCIFLLRDGSPDKNFIRTPNTADGFPEADIKALTREGGEIQFFEQAFEWDQLTYLYYSYFWGRRSTWLTSMGMDDPDPLFTKFLRSGAARVLVPVREHYEYSVLHYLRTSELWGGGEAPAIDDEMYVSIVAELKAQAGGISPDMLTGEEWDVTIPTSLVMLQQDAQLPNFTTPH